MTQTRFERGEKVRIKNCPISSVIGAKATIVRVRQDNQGKAYYKVRVGNFYIPDYALDEHLEKVK